MKIKLVIVIILISLMTAVVAGCSNTPKASANSNLPVVTRLALGTIKLEGTNQAVTSLQATELLTLWEGYTSISNSDTSSQVELDALIKQIQSNMTSDQIKAIDAMGLNDQSVEETLSTLGANATGNTPVSTPSASSNLNQTSPAGGPGGIAPGGDGINMGDIMSGVNAQSTPAATQNPAATGALQVNPILLRALIQLLETRSQATG